MSEFKKIHKRDIIRGVRDRWMKQYANYPDDKTVGWASHLRTTGDIRKALAALDLETCSSEDVDAAIGTNNWAKNECDQCDGDFETVLQLGQEPDYEARWWNMCASCLAEASLALPPSEGKSHG